jgi:putative ABC transport system permease protein
LQAAREPVGIGRSGGKNIVESLWHDVKVAFRMIRVKPAFSAAVIFMLALGIAGNTAIFSIFNGLFLRPLPFAEPERLVDLDEKAPKWNLKRVGISNADFTAWRKGNSTFDGMAFFDDGGANLSDGSGNAQRIQAAYVTYNLLDVLGLKPVIGRNFLEEEDRPNSARVVMIGYQLWQRLYRGDRNIVGQILKFDGQPFTVVGVLPREAAVPPEAEAWSPLRADPKQRGSYYLSGVGRLRRGVSLQQAEADLLRVHKAEVRDGNKLNEITSPILAPLRDRYFGDFRPVIRILLAAVGVVMLIACVNIAGLMLVRGEARAREIAIRSAVGASRARVVRQLLTESLLLALLGAAAGVLAGKLCVRGLATLMPDNLPRWVHFSLDWRFAVFAAALTGAAAVVFGLAPALHAAAVDARGYLQESARSTLSRGKRATLSVLVVGEIGLALILLVSSGLLLQAFRKVMHADPGYRGDNVLTWKLALPEARYAKSEQQQAFYSDLVARLRSLPGVRAASATTIVPLSGHSGTFFTGENSLVSSQDRDAVVLHIYAMPGYFETMGITLLAGRAFVERDGAPKTSPVAIVNETFARRHWATTEAAGRRIRYSNGKDWIQVVGVIRDTRHYGQDGEMRPSVLFPYQSRPSRGLTMVVRTANDPHTMVAPVREVIRKMDAELPMFEVRTMSERLNRSLWLRRAYSWLFAVFAVVAIVLAAAGIYGVISFSVSQRTREIGIRIALGARPEQVMRGVLRNGMVLVSIGVAVGVAASLWTGRFLETLLFGVSMRDAATYAVVVSSVGLVDVLANFVPARRAAAVDPIRALRAE